ncbi:MAG: AAA family ATPase, partial [Bacteroidales bacterium]|nr:AAA family ATPase [Bacteroidales bacterium]
MSVFLTGKAGTGKTTFLRKLRDVTPKRMVVLAPTGVAAINAQGQTIHSFFQLPTGPRVPGMESREGHFRMSKEKKKLIKTLDLLVVDEISMVRCDVLDAMDAELRKYRDRNKPFGGVQLLLIGDLQQLAPVAQEREWALLSPYYSTPYFFGSRALNHIQYVTIELKHIYRQQDSGFIDILGKIRTGRVDDACLSVLNARYSPSFVPPDNGGWIRLTTHNAMAQQYNEARLKAIKERTLTFKAEVSGMFPEKNYPAEENLMLKVGAQVMFVKNDPSPAKMFYNGKIGTVTGVAWDDDGERQVIMVHSHEDNRSIDVSPLVWENTKYVIDEKTKEIKEEVEGTFTQYPLRLAWAITVHKSQGLTFEHAVLDISDSFTHGQTYVALSRCRTLEGMVLARPVSRSAVITDPSVNAYIDKEAVEALKAEDKLPQMMYEYYYSLLCDMFDFRFLHNNLVYLLKVVNEHLYGAAPGLLKFILAVTPRVNDELVRVAEKFKMQYTTLMQSADYKTKVQERVKAASVYFDDKLREILAPVFDMTVIAIN